MNVDNIFAYIDLFGSRLEQRTLSTERHKNVLRKKYLQFTVHRILYHSFVQIHHENL